MSDTDKTTDCRYACAAFPHCGCAVEALSAPALDRDGRIHRVPILAQEPGETMDDFLGRVLAEEVSANER